MKMILVGLPAALHLAQTGAERKSRFCGDAGCKIPHTRDGCAANTPIYHPPVGGGSAYRRTLNLKS